MQKNSYIFRNTETILKKVLSSISLCLVQWPREDGLLWNIKKQSQVEKSTKQVSSLWNDESDELLHEPVKLRLLKYILCNIPSYVSPSTVCLISLSEAW